MQVMDGFRGLVQRPEEIEIGFGVTLDGKLGGVIASAGAGAHLDVTLRWRGSGPRATTTGATTTRVTRSRALDRHVWSARHPRRAG